jgi:hypothetical protein
MKLATFRNGSRDGMYTLQQMLPDWQSKRLKAARIYAAPRAIASDKHRNDTGATLRCYQVLRYR